MAITRENNEASISEVPKYERRRNVTKTIMAVFNSGGEARGVIEELLVRGFSQQDARVVSSDKCKVAKVASVPESESRCYAEAARRGGTLLLVKAQDGRAERAADLMKQRGAIQVEAVQARTRKPEDLCP
jgi:hypothetical protein